MELFQPPIEEGDMIIFPSNIIHEAPVNISEVRRTIISYNLRMCTDVVGKTL
jgi:ectoine hydroxylase-related dioxygenase (phytanoyl-CoA dioxygenase family)